jgi:hypothetical protein
MQGTCTEQSESIQGTCREHARNNQRAFREHSGNMHGTIREHSGNMQGTCTEHARNNQGAFREHAGNMHGTCTEQSGSIQGTCREHSGNIQGAFREHLVSHYYINIYYCHYTSTGYIFSHLSYILLGSPVKFKVQKIRFQMTRDPREVLRIPAGSRWNNGLKSTNFAFVVKCSIAKRETFLQILFL